MFTVKYLTGGCQEALRGYATEIGGVVGASRSRISCDLRIRAKGTASDDAFCRILGGDNFGRRRAFFYPSFQRNRHAVLRIGLSTAGQGAEAVRTGSEAAVLHAWNHVKADEVVGIFLP